MTEDDTFKVLKRTPIQQLLSTYFNIYEVNNLREKTLLKDFSNILLEINNKSYDSNIKMAQFNFNWFQGFISLVLDSGWTLEEFSNEVNKICENHKD